MTNETVTLQRRGHIAVITLNRPEAMNAINAEMSLAAERAIEKLISDSELRVAVLTGAGEAFCTGADFKEIAAGNPLIASSQREYGFGRFVKGYVDKPLIAAVNGSAFGSGTELMMSCDLAVMSEDADIGLPDVKRGIISGGGGLIRLPRKIPLAIALEHALTGRAMDAQTALRWGLVNRVVPQAEVLDAAIELASEIAANAPVAVAASKCVVHRSFEFGSDWLPEVWSFSDALTSAVMDSDDAKEGMRAFAEKRPPQWAGH